MSNQNAASRSPRFIFYIGAGVVPAVFLAVLSLIALLVTKHGALFSLLAWLGMLGLVIATFNPPAYLYFRSMLVIVALLTLGLIAISPYLLLLLGAHWIVVTVVGGPAVVALHYIWQVHQISNARERLRLAVLLICMMGGAVLLYLERHILAGS